MHKINNMDGNDNFELHEDPRNAKEIVVQRKKKTPGYSLNLN